MDPIIWLLSGAATGVLASIATHRRHSAQMLNILVGMGGAFVAGYLVYPMVSSGPINLGLFSLPALLVSLAGSVFLLAVVNFFRREKDINNEVFERRWVLVSDKIHTRWGKLTEEDVAKIDGNYLRFITMIKARYGCTDDEAEDQIQRYLKAILVDSRDSSMVGRERVEEQIPDQHI
jgi:uncharacterized membrane protein YeaQ/YmgE (transglycosylase-associated protein family)/uncharacterized protein YjbJ (UPF0337 family)